MKVIHAPKDVGDQAKFANRLLKDDAFDLLHMHLKAGEMVSKHHAKEAILIIVRDGIVEFDTEGEKVSLTDENILFFEPFEPHSLRAIEETDLLLIKRKE